MAAVQAGDFVAPGLLTALVGIFGVVLKMMMDARTDGYRLAAERAESAREMRDEDRQEMIRLREEVAALKDEVQQFTAELMKQREEKHAAINDLLRANLVIESVRRFVPACTCGAMDPIKALIERREQGG